jgi:hypothetical protein
MTVASPLSFPSGRVLVNWWPQLAPMQPRAVWIAHLTFHCLETVVAVARPMTLDRFSQLVLRALLASPDRTVTGLDAALHLGPQVLTQVLRRLSHEGLAGTQGSGAWHPTPLASQVLGQAGHPCDYCERRVFHFLERSSESFPERAPHFVHVETAVWLPWAVPESWRFDASLLATCLAQPAEWKQAHGFPQDVRHIPGLSSDTVNGVVTEWQKVILDRPEHLVAVLMLTPMEGGGERLLAFGVQPEGWVLQTAAPAVALAPWAEVLPELAEDLPLAVWRQAWRSWCQPRSIPPVEIEACTLEREQYRVRVGAPRRLVERLRAARSDALKGEAWLLAGQGALRSAALVELVEK